MPCVIRYILHNLKNVKNHHGQVFLFVKSQASAFNFTKSKTLPWVFFTFFKLYKWYQIAQRITYSVCLHSEFSHSFLCTQLSLFFFFFLFGDIRRNSNELYFQNELTLLHKNLQDEFTHLHKNDRKHFFVLLIRYSFQFLLACVEN